MRSDQINYDHVAGSLDDVGPMEMAFARPLKDVVPRLELLGFTIAAARTDYLSVVEAQREERQHLADDETQLPQDVMAFEEFCAFATAHSIESLEDTFIGTDDDASVARVRGRFSDERVTCRLPGFPPYDRPAYSERSYFGSLVDIIHPYSLLCLLAGNADNLTTDIVWQYGPLVDSGYASESEFVSGARRTQTFLIATEGSSDAHILKHAFKLLRPGIADFFRFIDVSERHPFPGTGNLLKFAEGLAKIDVQNRLLFVVDNDAEGYDAYRRLSELALPPNMRAIVLPESEAFRAFPARGPEGVHSVNINRRAAAIECYLDLRLEGYPPAQVVWTNYKREAAAYHGALEHKESYTNAFLKQTPETLAGSGYDVSKLQAVLDMLVAECTAIAMDLATASS